jgi:hypothetical protein
MSKYAFPSAHDPKTGVAQIGMTLRDYFAAKAMEAFISEGWIPNIYPPNDLVVAEHAYRMADAMMKEKDEAPRPSNLVDGDNVNP